MKTAVAATLGFAALVAMVSVATAGRPDKPDCAAALAAVQTAVAAQCDCATAATHGQYVRCAGQIVKALATDGTLGKSCKGAMVRVFAKSTCGKPDAVTCCFATSCLVKKSAVCQQRGGTAGAGSFCTDACIPASPSGAFIE